MRRLPSPADLGRGPLMRQLDQAARELNPILLFVAACLGIAHVGCLLAVEVGRLTPRSAAPTEIADPGAALHEAAVARLPPS